MIEFENTEVVGWEPSIRGMRNPKNSWNKIDSGWFSSGPSDEDITVDIDKEGYYELVIGPNDQKLMKTLRNAGTDHRKFMRMIIVYVDITAPLYWWKEFDTYKVGTVANSCSTMHKIAAKEFTLDDFSVEHLSEDVINNPFKTIIDCLNFFRSLYLQHKDKDDWWQMIQLLPSSYNQKRTVMLNYEVLANIYKSRGNHKLDEWSIGFMDWIKTLPYSELITGPSLKDIPICNEIMEEAKRRVVDDVKKEGYGMLEEFIRNELMAKGFEVSFSKTYGKNYGLSDSITIMISKNNKKVKQVVNTFEMENSNVSENVYMINVIKNMINMWNKEFEE